jgi:formylmethanofuran dehydrogenase subunit D
MYKVAGVSGDETIVSFLSRITTSEGATALVVDKNGMEKANGDINGGDRVKVTSADGKIEVFYTFGPLTAASVFEANNIQLYPNPTNAKININGINEGNRIQVYNAVGSVIRNVKVLSNMEIVSLEGQPSGMYMIVISNENKMLGRFKVLKQ